MSIKVLVKVFFKEEFINLNQEIETSFRIIKFGIQYKIGINCGGNISKAFGEILKNSTKNEFIFELTNDPTDINADILFAGDNVACFAGDNRIDFGESLSSRMNRIQFFLEELLNNKSIKSVSLDIDALNTFDYQEFDVLNIKVSNFANTMVELFKKEEQWTPTVRINFIE